MRENTLRKIQLTKESVEDYEGKKVSREIYYKEFGQTFLLTSFVSLKI